MGKDLTQVCKDEHMIAGEFQYCRNPSCIQGLKNAMSMPGGRLACEIKDYQAFIKSVMEKENFIRLQKEREMQAQKWNPNQSYEQGPYNSINSKINPEARMTGFWSN